MSKINSIISDAIAVITRPVEFYRGMAKTGGYTDPVIFIVAMAMVGAVLVLPLSVLGIGTIGGMAVRIGVIVMMPVFTLIGSFIGAAIVFVVWKLMDSNESYQTAFRCVAYAGALYPLTVIVGMIPYLGSMICVAWGMYLMVIAATEVHKLDAKSSRMVFGILGALLIFSNLSSEIAARRMASNLENMKTPFENISRQLQQSPEIAPEEAGRAMGEFIRSMDEAARKNAEQSSNANGNLSANNLNSENLKEMTPEQAGQALGQFFKGLNEATKDMKSAENGSQ